MVNAVALHFLIELHLHIGFLFSDNKGGIGEEHKKESGAYAVLTFSLL